MTDQQAKADWYPTEDGRLRYWDGAQWTDHFADRPSASPSKPSSTSARLKGAASLAARQLTSNEMDLPEGTIWSAIGKGVGGITTGRYRMDLHYLYFAKGALRTDAQQIPVSGIVDVDVKQTIPQRARGVWTLIVHVQRANGAREVALLEDIPDGPAAQRVFNQAAHDARMVLAHRSIHLDGLRHQATNTTRQEINWQGPAPGAVAPGSQLHPIVGSTVASSPTQIESGAAHGDRLTADPIEQLKALGALRDSGLLTDEEFSSKKAEILGRL